MSLLISTTMLSWRRRRSRARRHRQLGCCVPASTRRRKRRRQGCNPPATTRGTIRMMNRNRSSTNAIQAIAKKRHAGADTVKYAAGNGKKLKTGKTRSLPACPPRLRPPPLPACPPRLRPPSTQRHSLHVRRHVRHAVFLPHSTNAQIASTIHAACPRFGTIIATTTHGWCIREQANETAMKLFVNNLISSEGKVGSSHAIEPFMDGLTVNRPTRQQ